MCGSGGTPDSSAAAATAAGGIGNHTTRTFGCCRQVLLDCSVPGAKVFPDPLRPLSVPAVTCPNGTANGTRLVVFTGDGCPLTDTSGPCYWNSTGQLFQGRGCAAGTGGARCACQHLTDFAGQRGSITIKVASAEQMVSLDPADLVTKLKTLFGMVLGAAGSGLAAALLPLALSCHKCHLLCAMG